MRACVCVGLFGGVALEGVLSSFECCDLKQRASANLCRSELVCMLLTERSPCVCFPREMLMLVNESSVNVMC